MLVVFFPFLLFLVLLRRCESEQAVRHHQVLPGASCLCKTVPFYLSLFCFLGLGSEQEMFKVDKFLEFLTLSSEQLTKNR